MAYNPPRPPKHVPVKQPFDPLAEIFSMLMVAGFSVVGTLAMLWVAGWGVPPH